ncbi:AraC family transcriptional regulator [Cohnella nanjingensis]|uniref:Helix-turn-helix transcriptional regulator n=1 Tax=Cohnella nanjingensis TaxID=1387779 RepID=A0A7X0RP95_9BACL|nr:AraC family transcriptional regulator [Cohnella nanjingensis]MBB6670006.1 helix-turn-helix transcriptional regulator [Cohnella nanjingensis]
MRSHWSVQPIGYMYWHKKEQFLLERDTDSCWTMFAVESGQFAFRIGDREGEAGFGDVVVCPPDIAFHRRTITPLTFHFVKFAWEQDLSPEEADVLAGRWTVKDAERLLSTYRYMRELGSSFREEPAFGRMKHMIEDLWRLLEMERVSVESPAESDRPDPDMQRARQWLRERAYGPLAMSELAADLGISPVQLTRRFRAAYRTTPSGFVTELRLGRACRLLEETTRPLEWIAQQCGYENSFYLSRIFSAKLGMTPSAHRKLHRV